jgi:hypothetical protein
VKLHRLVLRNYRGITFREVEFPDRGVTVISGANEIGKTSMIEALDLLLESKDRSSKKEVKQVKPTHVDEGAEVTAEISTGPYRFSYFKRFHKRPVTELTVTAPSREQWTGDEAHERVRAILAETVDVALWQAQRVLQTASTAAVDLSGCDALSRALDAAGGQAVALSGAEPLLVDRIEVEFRQYFTATGRPTGEWATAIKRRDDARADVTVCEAAVAEVHDAVARHDAITVDLAGVAVESATAARRLEAARTRALAVEKVSGNLDQARVVADAARSAHGAAVAALDERGRIRAELDADLAGIGELESAVQVAAQDEAVAREVHAAAIAEAMAGAADVESRQADVDAARRVVDQIARRDEADRLAARIAKIDTADRHLTEVNGELGQIRLSERTMRLIEAAAAAVDVASAAAEAASARIEVLAPTPVEVSVDGAVVAVGPDAVWTTSATAPTSVEVPGVLTVRVIPGTPAAHTGEELDTKRQVLAQVLADADVADIAAARELDQRRRELTTSRDRTLAAREALLAEDDVAMLGQRLIELRTDLPADLPDDAAAARSGLDAASAAHGEVVAACALRRGVADAASKVMAEKITGTTVARSRLESAQARVAAATERLAQLRAVVGDDELLVTTEAAAERVRDTAAQVSALEAELASIEPAAVADELDEAQRWAAELGRRQDNLEHALVSTTAQLGVYGTEGRSGRLDAAQIECGRAEADWARLQRRSNAVALLRQVMVRHRDDARQRYVEPFRVEVERLGRIVFGPDFEVEIDAELRICSRTLRGCTVPYESLSGGAKEQLGIVARLASAALVAKEDGVPVVIDDALGFTDPHRLASMGEVFDAVGGDNQVIVLTCSPERYAGVVDAHRIELIA